MGVGETGQIIGNMGVGETGVGEMGVIHRIKEYLIMLKTGPVEHSPTHTLSFQFGLYLQFLIFLSLTIH